MRYNAYHVCGTPNFAGSVSYHFDACAYPLCPE